MSGCEKQRQRPVGVSPGQHAIRPKLSDNTMAAAAVLQAVLDEVVVQSAAHSRLSVVEVYRSPHPPQDSSMSSFSSAASSSVAIDHSDTKIFPKYSKVKQKVPVFNKIHEL